MGTKIITQLFIFAMIFGLAMAYPEFGYSQEPAVQQVNSSQISGEVMKVQTTGDNTVFTLNTGGQTVDVTVPNNVNITRNGVQIQASEVKPNDDITVTQNDRGEVLGVSAVSGKVDDLSKFLIPLAIATILGIGALMFFMQKANKGHIKTTTTNLQ
jgi:hypothetical protein